MVARLIVNELAVDAARVALLDGSRVLSSGAMQRPLVPVQTLGDTGTELTAFVQGLDTACHVLGDAARVGSMQLSALLFATDELDRLACYAPSGSSSGNLSDSNGSGSR